jgi:hypothetical protein
MVLIPKDRFLEILVHQLRRRFPSNNSLRRGDRPFTGLRHPRVRLSSNYRCLAEPKPSDVPRPFLGQSLLRFALFFRPKTSEPRRARGRSTLPAPLPDWPRATPKSLSLPVGGDRSFHPLRFLLSLAGLPVEAGTSVPITLEQCTSAPSRGSEKFRPKPVDNGETGNNRIHSGKPPQSVPLTPLGSARIPASSRVFSSSRFAPPSESAPAGRSS